MRSAGFSASTLGLVAAIAAPAAAFFRIPCPGRILDERVDPIVDPGAVSGHVHTIAGGNGFGFEMDYEQARTSTCSSCPIKQDLSNYWIPKLYYQYENGSFEDVTQSGDGDGVYGGMTVYYLQRPGPNNDTLKAFPEGFRMVAGDQHKRNATSDFASTAVSYVCLDYSGDSPQSHGFPNQNCPDGLRTQIFFPSCWDGVNLDSDDHKSHVAYPESGSYDNGPCPASHPVHLISLFFEVIWNTNDFADMWYGDSQPFVFSMGDPTGYGLHGDFVNGWDVDALQEAVDICTNLSGLITDCSVFDFFSTEESQACIVPTSIDEQITGVMDKLPGCNPITDGPGEASAVSDCAAPEIGSYKQYFTDVTSSLGFEYIGCGNDSTSQRTLSAASESTASMSVTSCINYCNGKGYTYAGMEYASQCYCGNDVASDRAPVTDVLGNCFSACSGNSAEFCGGSGALSLYKKCTSGSCSNTLYTAPWLGAGVASVASNVSSVGSSVSSVASSAVSVASSGVSSMAGGDFVASVYATSTSTRISTGTSTTASRFASTSSTSQSSSMAEASSVSESESESSGNLTFSFMSASSTSSSRSKKQGWTERQKARIAESEAAQETAEDEAAQVAATLAEHQD